MTPLANSPTHTPYDGTSKPFTIGLKQLDPQDWIEVDETYPAQIAEKERLYASIPDRVFVEEEGTRAAQQEVLDLLRRHLTANAKRLFGDGVQREVFEENLRRADRANGTVAPLRLASTLVQEDLILMRRGDDGWRLTAGALCFPSSWSLAEKFGRPLSEIHAPVPSFSAGTRNAELIERMFDKLAQPVLRYNWSIQSGDALYRPLSNAGRVERATQRPSKFPDGDIDVHAFIRVERQTLCKLPGSRDILFTIRIHLDPLRVLAGHPDRATLAASFAEQLATLDQAQLDYKGLTADRDRLVARLNAMC